MAVTWGAATTANNRTSETSTVLTVNSNATSVGDTLVAIIVADNSGTSGASAISGVTDSRGNQYDLAVIQNRTQASAANDGVTVAVYTAPCRAALVTSDTVTVSYSASVPAKCIWIVFINGSNATGWTTFNPTPYSTNVGSGSGATYSTGNTASLAVNDFIVVAAGNESATSPGYDTTDTLGGTYAPTNSALNSGGGGGDATKTAGIYQAKSTSASGVQTFTGTTGASTDWAAVILALKPGQQAQRPAQALATIRTITTTRTYAQALAVIGRTDLLYSALDDVVADDAVTYDGTVTSSAVFKVGLGDGLFPLYNDHDLIFRAQTTGTLTVKLYSGATLITTQTTTASSWTTTSYALSGAEISAITDFRNLSIEFTNSVGGTSFVTQAYLQTPQKGWNYWNAQAQAQIVSSGVTTQRQYAQTQADIKAISRGFAQAQPDIKAVGQGFAQAQPWIKDVGVTGYAQTQAWIKDTGVTAYGQAQPSIKAINVEGFGQAQTDIKATTSVFAQSQTDIKATSQVFAQSQADTKAVGTGVGQAHVDIKAVSQAFAQTQAKLNSFGVTGYAQAQADIDTFAQVFAQTQAKIVSTITVSAQAQASTKAVSKVFAQAQSTTKATSQVFAQSQTDIKAISTIVAQAQSDIKATSVVFAQSQANIKAVSSGFAQANADIKAVGQGLAQAQACVRGNMWGQAQADIKATSQGYGQSQVDIKATSVVFAQAQADTKAIGRGFGQAQADTKATSQVFAQAQSDVKAVGQVFAQTQADVKAVGQGYAQSQADIKAVGNGFGQSNSDIKAVNSGFGQSQADIHVIAQVFAQAQTDIQITTLQFAQAQTNIKAVNSGFGQAQADINATSSVFAQAQAKLNSVEFGAGQSQAYIYTPQILHPSADISNGGWVRTVKN